MYTLGLQIDEAKLGPEHVQVAYTTHKLGRCVREAGRLEEAEGLVRCCLEIKEAKIGPEDVQVANSLRALGVCWTAGRGRGVVEALSGDRGGQVRSGG